MISIGSYEIKKNHLLIIGILVLAFSISFLIRVQPMDYGFQLNEFDPFFNYRATEFIIENGLDEYFQWHDDLSWHPYGRNVSFDSQVMLHVTTAFSYWIFGGNANLYDFTVMFPIILGSLTVVAVFALVRTLAGTTAGLFGALLFSISMPIILRGLLGWYKSEPLGLFFGIIGIYLFLSGINSKNKKIVLCKLVGGGLLTTFSLSAWGGSLFFIIPLGLFIICLPFFRSDHKFLLWSIPVFTSTILLTSLIFERLSTGFIIGLEGFAVIAPTLFLVALIGIQKISMKNKRRNGIAFLFAMIILGSGFLIINAEQEFFWLPNYRYLNALNPLLTTNDPLVDSVSEHATTTLQESFFFHSSLMIISAIGIWILFTRKLDTYSLNKDMIGFSLILGITGVYISATFVRLEVFASLALIILSAICLSIFTKEITQKQFKNSSNLIIKPSLILGIIILVTIPLVIPIDNNWASALQIPPTILNGGSLFNTSTNDWLHALDWIKNNTPKDSVILSWWDYGYWIQTLGERTTLADNATLSSQIIVNVAQTLLSTPDDGWYKLNELDADYVLIFVAAEQIDTDYEHPLYLLDGGGDESKKHWIMRIAGEPLEKHLHFDGSSGTEYFWQNTILGQTIPFSPLLYYNLERNLQSETFQPGFSPLYIRDVKFNNNENEPLKLVYASPSFINQKSGPMIGVFIYEVNKDYQPNM